ncbi:hypothetical protein, partial [Klebsiella pneumoniae]|uniref:hypothetical protein n=3 Tax=Klebsiella TaxID=570 RepID=UPI000A270B4D
MALTPAQIRYLNQCEPGEPVSHALSELLFNDHDLLSIDANERSITFRFAMYLQLSFPGWNVDCEYNRDGVEPKRLRHLELYPDSEDVEAKTVFPDVIVHRRGTQLKWFTEFGHLNRGDMLTSEQHRCHNE